MECADGNVNVERLLQVTFVGASEQLRGDMNHGRVGAGVPRGLLCFDGKMCCTEDGKPEV